MKELKHRCGILMALCWYTTQPDWDPLSLTLDFPDGSVEKKKKIHLPTQAMKDTWVQSLGQEDALK